MKRMIVILLAALGLVLASSGITGASAEWACVGIKSQDFGVCVDNPVPTIPRPELPSLPL